MKPIQVVLLIILAFFLIIVFLRSCQDDSYIGPSDVQGEEAVEHTVNDTVRSEPCPKIPDTPSAIDSDSILAVWPDSILLPTTGVFYLSSEEKEIIIEINKCRTNPRKYAEEVLRPFLCQIDNRGIFVDSKGNNIITSEGKSAVVEAIEDLYKKESKPMLYPREYLCQAAQDHCNDHGPKSLVGHGGSDGSSPLSRVQRYKNSVYGIGENIDYGTYSPEEIIRSLIVDDGVSDRGHRKNFFSDYRFVGLAIAPHAGYNIMCVIDMEM